MEIAVEIAIAKVSPNILCWSQSNTSLGERRTEKRKKQNDPQLNGSRKLEIQTKEYESEWMVTKRTKRDKRSNESTQRERQKGKQQKRKTKKKPVETQTHTHIKYEFK